MNTKLGLLGLTMAGVAALVVSCGSSSSDNQNTGGSSTAGSGGKAGASTAGTTNNNTSGSSSGGKSGGSNGGSNSNGGSANNGGITFGGFNFGGAGPDLGMFMCAEPVPQTGAACTADSQPCLNGTEVCYCQMDKWTCTDIFGGAGGAGPTFGNLDCPEAKPMDGVDCGDITGFCPYGGQNMGCACYNGAWACSQ